MSGQCDDFCPTSATLINNAIFCVYCSLVKMFGVVHALMVERGMVVVISAVTPVKASQYLLILPLVVPVISSEPLVPAAFE